jgi:polyhydroxybutyrate depolymerase
MTMKDAWRWLIAGALLVLFVSGCGYRATASTTTPRPTTSSGTTSAPTAPTTTVHAGIVNAPVSTSGCGKVAPAAPGTSVDQTISSGNIQRQYRLHVPVGYDPQHPTPLVLNIHGHGGTASWQERNTNYSALADQQHFLVVYPQGTLGSDSKTGWATGGKVTPRVNDVLFFSDLLTALQQQLCVDAHRIYATGMSNGGGMTNLLACQMAGRIAAVAPVAAAIYRIVGGCHPTRPIPYLEFHGTSDPLVYYNGGPAPGFLPVMQTMQEWAERDGCTSGPATFFQKADVTGFQWTGCRGGAIVEHYRIQGGGHAWPDATMPSPNGVVTHTISATTAGWQFFQQYRLS